MEIGDVHFQSMAHVLSVSVEVNLYIYISVCVCVCVCELGFNVTGTSGELTCA